MLQGLCCGCGRVWCCCCFDDAQGVDTRTDPGITRTARAKQLSGHFKFEMCARCNEPHYDFDAFILRCNCFMHGRSLLASNSTWQIKMRSLSFPAHSASISNRRCNRPLSIQCNLTRREASALLLGTSIAVQTASAAPLTRSTSCAPLDPALSAAFMEAVYQTVQLQQVGAACTLLAVHALLHHNVWR